MVYFLCFDTDSEEDNYRPSKRSRADFRPPASARSYDDNDGMQSSPGRSQRENSRDDVPMTDHSVDDQYEVFKALRYIFSSWKHFAKKVLSAIFGTNKLPPIVG